MSSGRVSCGVWCRGRDSCRGKSKGGEGVGEGSGLGVGIALV